MENNDSDNDSIMGNDGSDDEKIYHSDVSSDTDTEFFDVDDHFGVFVEQIHTKVCEYCDEIGYDKNLFVISFNEHIDAILKRIVLDIGVDKGLLYDEKFEVVYNFVVDIFNEVYCYHDDKADFTNIFGDSDIEKLKF